MSYLSEIDLWNISLISTLFMYVGTTTSWKCRTRLRSRSCFWSRVHQGNQIDSSWPSYFLIIAPWNNHELLLTLWNLRLQVKLSDYIGKKYVILFFYPLDFTFVCPTGDSIISSLNLFTFFGKQILISPHYVSDICRNHCFQWSPCRIWQDKHWNFGCFCRQCGIQYTFHSQIISWCFCC